MNDHAKCLEEFRGMAAAAVLAAGDETTTVDGLEITEGERPAQRCPWLPVESYTCPHGIAFHVQPTEAQLDAWLEAGTP